MKKMILAILVFSTLLNFGCKKSESTTTPYTCQTCKKTPDALAANDAKSKGIYKSVIIGSSGTIMFDIMNSGTTITATMVLDGVTIPLTSTATWVNGQPFVGAFTGTLNGSAISINFSVGYDGTNPIVTTSSIPGHPNASFTVVKETSSMLVECFEGTYSSTKPETGTFNLLLSRSAKMYVGSSRETGTTVSDPIELSPINAQNQLTDNQGSYRATLTGDVIDGNFKDSNGSTITVHAIRTW